MKQFILQILFIVISYTSFTQTLDDLEFGTDITFEVVTWNIEHYPKQGETTVNYVKQIIQNLDVDLWALQEIEDEATFNDMVADLDGYAGLYRSAYYDVSLAYIYNTNTLVINDAYEIYTTSDYWNAFPRAPFVIDLTFMGESFVIINNHFKCCDGSEDRRLEASNLLKEYIDSYFPNHRVIVVGDLNDILTDIPSLNVFQSFIDDSENYEFADMAIAEGSSSDWSYPSWPSHLDHVLITDEMFAELENNGSAIEVIKVDEYLSGGWSTYDTNISDHRPVGLKLEPNIGSGIKDENLIKLNLQNYPNPFKGITNFLFDSSNEYSEIEIYTINGKKIQTIQVSNGENSVVWNAEPFPNGIYFAKLLKNKMITAVTKLVLVK